MTKIAVIGGGISGMVAAWMLRKNHHVTLFESSDYLGGHTHTHLIPADGAVWPVDTGFIVFNDKTYPLFRAFLNRLGVASRPTSMSFSVSSRPDDFEYNGTSFNTLLAQRRNVIRPKFWRMLRGILRFNEECKSLLAQPTTEETLGEFLKRRGFSRELGEYYIRPMTGAVWSAGTRKADLIPIYFIARFFENHGFLNINDRPQWFTVAGGSHTYAKQVAIDLGDSLRLRSPIISVQSENKKQLITTASGELFEADHVIFTGHSDQMLKIIQNPSPAERNILGAIPYVANDVVLHTDVSLMPKRKLAWAAWNYHMFSTDQEEQNTEVSVTYNMNILQGHSCPTQFLVSLNCAPYIDPSKIIKRLNYDHPVFTKETIAAQARHGDISGANGRHFCGAYWANGFHEDGVWSAVRVVNAIDPALKAVFN